MRITRSQIILYSLVLLAGLNWLWGFSRASSCLGETEFAGSLLQIFPLMWVGISVIWMGYATLHQRGRGVSGWLLLLYSLGGIFAFLLTNSIPCLMSSTWMILILMMLGLIFLCFKSRSLRPQILAFVGVFSIMMGSCEGLTRLYMRLNHGYRVQTQQPEPTLGWYLVPSQQYTFTGTDPVCISFRNEITTNALGFRDEEHTPEKPENTLRIAVLGDSFIEALQVSDSERATQVLADRLAETPPVEATFEVFNFGVSNYSVGQNYVTYLTYAEAFDFDYVFILVSEHTIERTNDPYFNTLADARALRLRPSFTLENGELIATPPQDYELAIARYYEAANPDGTPYNRPVYLRRVDVNNWRNQPVQSLIARMQFFSFMSYRVVGLMESFLRQTQGFSRADQAYYQQERPAEMREINLAVLNQLNQAVITDGAQLIIIDDTYSPRMSEAIADFATEMEIAYLQLNQQIIAANKAGQATSFMCDGHYNAHGNRLLADLMFDWLETHLPT